jgi:HPt (histidine-containing phosphotransfer) domain-containing protein
LLCGIIKGKDEVFMVIEQRVSQARVAYGAKLCERVAELGDLLEDAATDPEALAAAQRIAHRIYGSAGTFGYAEVGEAARAIDQLLLQLLEGKLSSTPELWRGLGRLLAQAREGLCPT